MLMSHSARDLAPLAAVDREARDVLVVAIADLTHLVVTAREAQTIADQLDALARLWPDKVPPPEGPPRRDTVLPSDPTRNGRLHESR